MRSINIFYKIFNYEFSYSGIHLQFHNPNVPWHVSPVDDGEEICEGDLVAVVKLKDCRPWLVHDVRHKGEELHRPSLIIGGRDDLKL